MIKSQVYQKSEKRKWVGKAQRILSVFKDPRILDIIKWLFHDKSAQMPNKCETEH